MTAEAPHDTKQKSPTTWIRVHPALDVWHKSDAMVSGTAIALREWIRMEADRSKDCFAASYQNIVDPNLSVQYMGALDAPHLKATSISVGGGVEKSEDKACGIPLSSPIRSQTVFPTEASGTDSGGWSTDDIDGENVYNPPQPRNTAVNPPPAQDDQRSTAEKPPAQDVEQKTNQRSTAGKSPHQDSEQKTDPRRTASENDKTSDSNHQVSSLPSADSALYRWIAVNCEIDQKGTVHLRSDIPRYSMDDKKNRPLYNAVNEILNLSVEPLCELRNWAKYGQTSARRQRHRQEELDFERAHSGETKSDWEYQAETDRHAQYAESRKRPDLPFDSYSETAIPVPFQIVVKVQRVIVQPGKSYKGVWHDEGLHEKILAAMVYYTDVSSDLHGGAIQFAPKGDMDVEFGHMSDIQDAWRKRIKHSVPVQTGSAVFFSNFQTVHRVLEIENKSSKPQVREFVCLFIVDPLHAYKLPSVVRLDNEIKMERGLRSELYAIMPEPLLKMIQEYREPDPRVFYSIQRARTLREILFRDQMKPKQNGTWMLYSTGNGDCKSVGWSSVHPPDFLTDPEPGGWCATLHGTDDDWIPTPSDDDNEEARQKRIQRSDRRETQTRAF